MKTTENTEITEEIIRRDALFQIFLSVISVSSVVPFFFISSLHSMSPWLAK